uniref:Uncharacterized protein n=1 Tax=Strigamia maritima TaxID=126957 RepID=T1IWC1_STRMM
MWGRKYFIDSSNRQTLKLKKDVKSNGLMEMWKNGLTFRITQTWSQSLPQAELQDFEEDYDYDKDDDMKNVTTPISTYKT